MAEKILALIPARGGSKGVPGKNIRPLNGHPLIAYSIKACLDSGIVDRCMVSTDSREIAEIAEQYGAEIPFLRPAELAQDASPDQPVFVHALDWLQKHEGYQPDFVLHLRPTCPFRTPEDSRNVVKLWKDSGCDAVRSVSLVDAISHPYWAFVENAEGLGEYFTNDPEIQEKYGSSRQLLPPVYKAHGRIDAYTPESIFSSDDMLGEKLKLYIVSDTVDIDTVDDFEYAEFLLARKKISFRM